MYPQPAYLSRCDAAEMTARYIRAVIRWWSPRSGVPGRRLEDNQREAVQRWEQEGGSLSG